MKGVLFFYFLGEQSVELLLAISESLQEEVNMLIPPLMKMGLPSLLTSLLASEISLLMKERVPERYISLVHSVCFFCMD